MQEYRLHYKVLPPMHSNYIVSSLHNDGFDDRIFCRAALSIISSKSVNLGIRFLTT
jgi:hypothetical protein